MQTAPHPTSEEPKSPPSPIEWSAVLSLIEKITPTIKDEGGSTVLSLTSGATHTVKDYSGLIIAVNAINAVIKGGVDKNLYIFNSGNTEPAVRHWLTYFKENDYSEIAGRLLNDLKVFNPDDKSSDEQLISKDELDKCTLLAVASTTLLAIQKVLHDNSDCCPLPRHAIVPAGSGMTALGVCIALHFANTNNNDENLLIDLPKAINAFTDLKNSTSPLGVKTPYVTAVSPNDFSVITQSTDPSDLSDPETITSVIVPSSDNHDTIVPNLLIYKMPTWTAGLITAAISRGFIQWKTLTPEEITALNTAEVQANISGRLGQLWHKNQSTAGTAGDTSALVVVTG